MKNQPFDVKCYHPKDAQNVPEDEVVDFLYKHLDEFGDAAEDIRKCLHYAISEKEGMGGRVITARDTENNQQLAGVVILNQTGMQGYIPENILVYIAVHADYRGKGLGKILMSAAEENVEGSIALHVEPNNPARFLYEKAGYTNKYLEYRLNK